VHFEKDVPAVFVVFDRKALKERVTVGAGGGSKSGPHASIMLDPLKECNGEIAKMY
jgi:hypothetical protein